MLPLMRSSMTESVSESVCIGSPRARRPLVVWLRFAASRLGRSRGAVYLLSHRLETVSTDCPSAAVLGSWLVLVGGAVAQTRDGRR